MRHLVLLAGVALVAGSARAATYPVNACVATKQKLAAGYCAAAFGASEKWETSQDAAARDAKLEAAGAKLAERWAEAEDESAEKGSDCADATLTSAAAIGAIDSAIGAIVGEVNDGLDLDRKK